MNPTTSMPLRDATSAPETANTTAASTSKNCTSRKRCAGSITADGMDRQRDQLSASWRPHAWCASFDEPQDVLAQLAHPVPALRLVVAALVRRAGMVAGHVDNGEALAGGRPKHEVAPSPTEARLQFRDVRQQSPRHQKWTI